MLASHRLTVRWANATSIGTTAVAVFNVVPEYGDPPDSSLVATDLRRMLEGRLDVEERLERRARSARPRGAVVAPPKVTLVDDASLTATVVEVGPTTSPACCGGSGARWAAAAWTCARPGWRRWGPRRSTSSTSPTRTASR